jgi:hypothetical protein
VRARAPVRPRFAGHRQLRTRRYLSADEAGNAALVTFIAMTITIVVFMAAINLIVDEYGKGAIRTAVDEAAHAGSLQGAGGGPIAACQAKAAQVMSGLLNGPFGHHITVSCTIQAGQVVATASGNLPGWLTIIPVDPIHVVDAAQIETNP